MAKFVDLREPLRLAALQVQRENVARLTGRRGANGQALAPKKAPGQLGVKTGEMLAELGSPANVDASRTSAKIGVSSAVAPRLAAFVSGSSTQPARDFLGVSTEATKATAAAVAKTARDQFCQALGRRRRS